MGGGGQKNVKLSRRWLAYLLLLAPLPTAQGAMLEGRNLTFEVGGKAVLTRHFPAELGELRGPVSQGDTVWLGIGPKVYGFSQTGQVQTRLDFSGPVRALDAGAGGDLLTVTAGESGSQDTYTVSGGEIRERVVLPPLQAVTGWLEQAAALATPAEVLQAENTDPTNPFLALRHAALLREQGDTLGAISEMQRAAGLEVPFPAALRLAAQMEAQGAPSAANLLLSRAGRDYAARGYDPALPLSRQALRRYGDPLATLDSLLQKGRLDRADVWLRYLRTVSPRFERAEEVYERYAALLDSQGRGGEAQEWRNFSRSLRSGTLYHLGPDALLVVQQAAQLLMAALVLTLLAACVLLLARSWEVQTYDLNELGGRWRSWRRPLQRLRRTSLGYAGIGEKLVLLSLLLGLVLSLLSWSWAARTQAALAAPVMNMGTYGGAWFYDQLADLEWPLRSRDGDLLRGLAAQLDGEDTQARRYYQAAEQEGSGLRGGLSHLGSSLSEACILNNLAVLSQQQGNVAGAREQWRSALSAAPDLLPAAYNLGLQTSDPSANFQRQYGSGPMLCYPDQRSTISALGGSLRGQVSAFTARPVATLLATPTGLAPAWQWAWVLGLLSLGGYTLLMTVLPSRPLGFMARGLAAQDVAGQTHTAQNQAASKLGRRQTLGGLPRSLPFQALALLLPGSAWLDGAWGGVLLLAWSWLVLGGLAQSRGLLTQLPLLGGPSTLLLLVLIYGINCAALAFKQWRYWQKLRQY